MAIVFSCACGKQLSSKEEFAGRRIRCPACQEIVTIPGTKVEQPDGELPRAVKKSPWFDPFLGQKATPWRPGDEARYQTGVMAPREGPRRLVRWVVVLLLLCGVGFAGYLWLPDFMQRVQVRMETKPVQADERPMAS